MKRTVLLLVSCLLVLGALVAPAQARVMNDDVKVVINGVPYQGEWAWIGDRPFVGIESFGKALGYPRQHHVLGWCLNPTANAGCDVSPFELAVKAKGSAIQTVRFGGNTMVDLRQALEVLQIPFHYRFYDRALAIGNPYYGETMKGAWHRCVVQHNDCYQTKPGPWPPRF